MKRSGRNICFSGSNAWVMLRDVIWPPALSRSIDHVTKFAVFGRVRGVIIVEGYGELREIRAVLLSHALDELLRRDAFLLGAQHDRRAVGVVGAHVDAVVTAHLLKTHPDVGLDVFHQVSQMNGTVGIRKGAGDEYSAGGLRDHGGFWFVLE